jgi:hypothetical protein
MAELKAIELPLPSDDLGHFFSETAPSLPEEQMPLFLALRAVSANEDDERLAVDHLLSLRWQQRDKADCYPPLAEEEQALVDWIGTRLGKGRKGANFQPA